MPTWSVNTITGAVALAALTLAHFGIVPMDIALLIAGGLGYQLTGQLILKGASQSSQANSTTAPRATETSAEPIRMTDTATAHTPIESATPTLNS